MVLSKAAQCATEMVNVLYVTAKGSNLNKISENKQGALNAFGTSTAEPQVLGETDGKAELFRK